LFEVGDPAVHIGSAIQYYDMFRNTCQQLAVGRQLVQPRLWINISRKLLEQQTKHSHWPSILKVSQQLQPVSRNVALL